MCGDVEAGVGEGVCFRGEVGEGAGEAGGQGGAVGERGAVEEEEGEEVC